MAHYSIKDLERLSGIQAHTIRIWEKRYQLVHPSRTTTNIRVYNDVNLKRLLNVAMLNRNGLKISKIAKLTEVELNKKVMQLAENFGDIQNQVENMVLAMVELNEEKFETLIDNLVAQNGFDKTITSVMYPFLVRIGTLWQTGEINPAQEHFVANIIRRKIMVAIDKLGPYKGEPKNAFIVFLPEGEYHDIGILFYAYLVKKHGLPVIYLGQSVPVSDVASVQESYKAENVFVSLTTPMADYTTEEYLAILNKTFKKSKLYVSGSLVSGIEFKKSSSLIKVKSIENFEELLSKLK
jgi:MerR family transcriptional regulator, light-induced transcriptional regulator